MKTKEEEMQDLGKILKDFIQTSMKLVEDVFHLAGAEARLAAYSLRALIFLSFLLCALLVLTASCFLASVVVCLMALKVSLMMSFLIATLLSISMVLLVMGLMLRMKQNLFFPATRQSLRTIREINKGGLDDEITTKNQTAES